MKPLAEQLRPQTLDQYLGQDHLVGQNGALRKSLEVGRLPSIVLWGPPGVGKTTLALLLAKELDAPLYQLSAVNTFITGMSNGGELCYLLACEVPNVFRAFAPVAGTIFPNGLTNNICTPTFPVPIFETHGRNDNITLFQGDPFDQYWGPYLAIDTIINFWVDHNSLTDLVVDTFPNLNNNNKITISQKYSASNTNNEVWLYTHESGHNWGDDGDIVIEEEIWLFFSRMSLSLSLIHI